MSAVPATESAAKRRIGDILLELGFVSEEALAEAALEQEETGQPLGQILVQHGVITRLELASALAEQWSDPAASIPHLTRPAPNPRPAPQRPSHDDAQYAARLQDAVADLARRMQTSQPPDGVDGRVTELAERIEATVARAQRIEATVATLAERLGGVTDGVGDGFGTLQAGMGALAVDLARVESTLAEIVERPVEPPQPDPVLSARLEELRDAVTALAERPAVDEGVRGRVEELASRLETLVDGAALDDLRNDLRGALRELEGRPPGDPELGARLDRVEALAGEGAARAEVEAQAAMLAELRETLSELEARPVGSPAIDARLEELRNAVTALAERPAVDEGVRGRVEELASRLETLVDGAALDDLHNDLRGALRELEGRPPGDPELEARLDRVEALAGEGAARAEVEAQAAMLAELRETLSELEARPVGSPEIDARLERIESALLDQQITADDTSALDTLAARIGVTSDALDDLRGALRELEARPVGDPELGARLDRVEALAGESVARAEVEAQAAMLAELRETLSELEARPVGSPAIDARLERIESALLDQQIIADDTSALDTLSARIDRASDVQEDLVATIETLGARIEDVNSLAERPVADETVRGRVEELASRLETLVDGAALDDLRGALRELEGRPAGGPELEARIDRVEALAGEGVARAEVELRQLRETLSELEARPVGGPGIDARLERIESALLDQQIIADDTSALDTLMARVDMTSDVQEDLVATIETLSARIEDVITLADRPAADDAVRGRVDEIVSRLEGMEARLASELVTTGDLSRALADAREQLAPFTPGPDGRIAELVQDLASVRDELARMALAPRPDPGVAGAVDTLVARIEQLEDRRAGDESLAAKIAALEGRLASDLVTTADLTRAIAEARADAAIAAPSPDDPPATDELRRELDLRLEDLVRAIDERFVAIGPAAPAAGEPTHTEDEMDRVLMAIERVGLHLGEHDRALAELMRSRGVTQKLDELSARIDEVAAAGAGGGAAPGAGRAPAESSADLRALMRRVDEAETSSLADREKLMNRLERMASSIDWRLQRLESDDTETESGPG